MLAPLVGSVIEIQRSAGGQKPGVSGSRSVLAGVVGNADGL